MTAALAYPLINGVRHGYSSIEFKLAGQIFVGFKSINYGRKRSRSFARGNHPDPLGKTRGTNEYNADCELFLAEWNLFQAQLVAVASTQGLGTGYGDVLFQTLVTYGENQFDTVQDIINGCTVDETTAGQSEGPDPLIRKLDLSPLKILFNGIDDLAVPLVGVAT